MANLALHGIKSNSLLKNGLSLLFETHPGIGEYSLAGPPKFCYCWPTMDLKAKAHSLKPIVMVGKNGITESLIQEIDAGLKAHELIKIKFQEGALEILEQDPTEWLAKLRAELVNTQGHIMTLYRKNPKKKKA